MQREIDGGKAALKINILGVNEVGSEGGNGVVTYGRSLPWLQEKADHSIWNSWGVLYRDVIILDGENHQVAVYNLTNQNLGISANYDSLKSLLENLSATYSK